MAFINLIWIPTAGDMLVGQYVGLLTTGVGAGYHVLRRCEDEKGKSHPGVLVRGTKVLDSQIQQQFVAGDHIAIEYGGLIKGRSGYDYHDWRVVAAPDPAGVQS